jgi:pimeloyl-ACP methyl ester carboxylesterase
VTIIAQATANGIQIEYDTFGDRSGRPLLMIHGLGCQLIEWPEDFCTALAERGHFVIRFDNRDVGLSTKFEQAGIPKVMEVMSSFIQGERIDVPYTLEDMADDSVALLDALGIARAHVGGISMGVTIAQIIAVRHPSRVASLISIASSTGNLELSMGDPEAWMLLLTPPLPGREAPIERYVKFFRAVAGPNQPFDEAWLRSFGTRAYNRSFYPPGSMRQMAAVVSTGNRKLAIAQVIAPHS